MIYKSSMALSSVKDPKTPLRWQWNRQLINENPSSFQCLDLMVFGEPLSLLVSAPLSRRVQPPRHTYFGTHRTTWQSPDLESFSLEDRILSDINRIFWGRHVSYWCCDMLWHSISSQMSHASQMVQKVWSINHSIPRWTPQKAPWGLTILWLWHFGYQQRSFKKNMSCQTCETKVTLELQTLRTFTQATLWNTISPGQHNWFKPASLDRACFFKVPDDFDPHRPHYPDSSADLMTTNCDENSLSGGNGKKSIGR